MSHGSIVTELIFSNHFMIFKGQQFHFNMRVYESNTYVQAFSPNDCMIIVMSKHSILTPSSVFFTDLIFSSWSLINKIYNFYVSMCVMGPVQIKFNQSS